MFISNNMYSLPASCCFCSLQWSVLLPVVLTLVATQQNQSGFLKKLADLCYTKWALEAFVVATTKRLGTLANFLLSHSVALFSLSLICFRYSGVWLITRCGSLLKAGYDLNNWALCLSSLIIAGLITRAVAFCFMVVLHKK